MDSEYDRKFEEMKEYIPFLESMIKRLESTNSTSTNPRQAQLDKIRSLRDLLLDKKKRMKMENLLKCEQVLVNLYAKVEQRETLPGIKKASESYEANTLKNKADFEAIRNKLKTVTTKRQEIVPDTLPEIERASKSLELCTPGSKEPALFQRRPNKNSISPNRQPCEESKSPLSMTKRNYTRVLVSPERSGNRWPSSDNPTASPLYSRRSPRRSPRRHSPSYHKRDRKKSKQSTQKQKDLNITLKVPEESLNSLNTKDILSRIINCSDSDVDIDTLRELRSQILGELKQTGQSDDISDLILKSYKKKSSTKKAEIEEGELSDSESEAIESIYGSLVIVEKDQSGSSSLKTLNDKEQPRKIQICLVINSDKETPSESVLNKDTNKIDETEFQMYDQNKNSNEDQDLNNKSSSALEVIDTIEQKQEKPLNISVNARLDGGTSVAADTIEKGDVCKDQNSLNKNNSKADLYKSQAEPQMNATNSSSFTPNFYKPRPEQNKINSNNIVTNDDSISTRNVHVDSPLVSDKSSKKVSDPQVTSIITKLTQDSAEIPLLNETIEIKPGPREVVSEIDILQALKNEILGETANISEPDIVTPPLHQPKITKVANSQEILQKKKISIEKYKEKSVSSSRSSLLLKDSNVSVTRDEHSKKQSLKLTEKECERFNFSKITLHNKDSSDSDDKEDKDIVNEIYDNLVPKSPDHDDFSTKTTITKPPVIIPIDPVNVKNLEINTKGDIDMRTMTNSRNIKTFPTKTIAQPQINEELSKPFKETKREVCDPRSRKDSIPFINSNPNEVLNTSRSFPVMSYPNANSNATPNSRVFEMTPTHTSFDNESFAKSHVYPPMFSYNQSENRERSRSRWDNHDNREKNKNWEDYDPRKGIFQREPVSDFQISRYQNSRCDRYSADLADEYSYNRVEGSRTPVPSFGRSDRPTTPSHSFGRLEGPITSVNPFALLECPGTPKHPFGISESPATPSHPFGRVDCPSTPNHVFGRADCPPTSSQSFGRTDCPRTPVHPFGRSDCPQTISQSFGRIDCPPTPSYPFGRMDCPATPNHSFGRSDFPQTQPSERSFINDPRLKRNNDYEMDERDYYKDRKSEKRPYGRSESYRNYDRERSVGRNERNAPYTSEPSVFHQYTKDRVLQRESSGNESAYTENENRFYNRDRSRAWSKSNYSKDNSREYEEKRRLETNTLIVQSHAGRSFTIDTSINNTFQNILESDKKSFDDRRQRAASVGRVVACEVGESRKSSLTKMDSNFYNKSKSYNFKRSSSVGRDISKEKSEKSFSEIKEYFKSHDFAYLDKPSNINRNKLNNNRTETKIRDDTCRPSRSSRREFNDSHQEREKEKNKRPYSPRKNYRDPRVHRNQYESKSRYKEGERSSSYVDRKHHGLIYSNDNIARGTILGLGYGVKNYKIPKIKRPPEEKNENDRISADKDNTSDEQIKVQSNNEKQISTTVDKTIENKKPKSKPTNSIAENKTLKNENITNKKKTNRPIIYDSDSESESEDTVKSDSNKVKEDEATTKPSNTNILSSEDKQLLLNLDEKNNEREFCLDIDIFTDNMVSDPVINNINALIEDLDNDLKAPDSNSSKDICIEIENDPVQVVETNTAIAKYVIDTKKFEKSGHNKEPQVHGNEYVNNKTDNKSSESENKKFTADFTTCDTNENESSKSNTNKDKNNIHNEGIVSTTNEEQRNVIENVIKDTPSDSKNESCSTPDSTNSTEELCLSQQESLPDSTNEMQSEMNSDITSTHDSTDIPSKTLTNQPTSSSSKSVLADPVVSVGSLLSILQHKSKIKELLNMLGEQSSANEKIKKKLEKLSEIVSDDEDADECDVSVNQTTDNKVEASITITDNKIDSKKSPVVDATSSAELKSLSEEFATVEPGDSLKDTSVEENKNVDENKEIESEATNNITTSEVPSSNKLPQGKKIIKKVRTKRGRYKRKGKGQITKNSVEIEKKRVTRAAILESQKPKAQKKPSRELQKLQEDIKDVYRNDDILKSTGIRTCRIIKLADEKNANEKGETRINDVEPIVILEKFNAENNDSVISEKSPKLKLQKPKDLVVAENKNEITIHKYRPGPKSKTKTIQKDEYVDLDPYAFETDSVKESNIAKLDDIKMNSSDSESSSLASSKSFGSSELLIDTKKKPKRKRRGWQSGIIKPKSRKKKEIKPTEPVSNDFNSNSNDSVPPPPKAAGIPDVQCFTDKNYCFRKNIDNYACRLCDYKGKEIVSHYKYHHPHSEIPLSRMSPAAAKEAIQQCEEINFQTICKMSTNKYVCRFCFLEFTRKKAVLETFFWHVVSMHTGEYKRLCSECVNINSCPFNLDIPPPPKDVKGQLIGYICGKCNFTQISLENLKTHVIVRHNDEQTEVYTINLAVMSRKTMYSLLKHSNASKAPRVLRSKRNHSVQEAMSDDHSDITDSSDHIVESETNISPQPSSSKTNPLKVKTSTKIQHIQSKITFENDDILEMETNQSTEETSKVTVKLEKEESNAAQEMPVEEVSDTQPENIESTQVSNTPAHEVTRDDVCSDVVMYPHFKQNFTNAGNKEYVCCINGNDNHYKTTLLISMRKHVQMKHAEKWDGYCYLCKVIVMPQGVHCFKDCLQHYLDKHIDNFPVLEADAQPQETETPKEIAVEKLAPTNRVSSPKPYINVRPLSELMSQNTPQLEEVNALPLPIIESVVSLGTLSTEPPLPSPTPTTSQIEQTQPDRVYKYEEAQSEVMSQKNGVVLEAMMSRNKLVQVFKCAAIFCSYTTDKVNHALLHVSTHKRVGGLNALRCSYCDYDCSDDAVDLVTHVFKNHGSCQYVCTQCFYRAAASQLVGAHMQRIHSKTPEVGSVLRSTFVTPNAGNDSDKMLTREEAVPYYICSNADSEGNTCKFRTYMPATFCEHLSQRHVNAESYVCNYCSQTAPYPTELVVHLNGHGLRMYQCTWCVFAAHNERMMLLHASEKHPHKQPQAYLRIITNKEGGSGLRVLPLAYLNKAKIPTRDVSADNDENPVKAAEKSIELEQLISSTTILTNDSTPAALSPPPPDDIPQTDTLVVEPTPVPQAASLEETPQKEQEDSEGFVYWVNEERDKPSVIDITDDDTPALPDQDASNAKKVALEELMRCSKCNADCKSAASLKRHLKRCFGNNARNFPCAYCMITTLNVNGLINHYVRAHSSQDDPYICGICNQRGRLLSTIRQHMKDAHSVMKLLIETKHFKDNRVMFIVTETPKSRQTRKRKLSLSVPDTPKPKRYGPEDIEKLPINPILDELVYCSLCKFKTKVRTNMVRHLQQHEKQQPVAQTAPVNPVPHLETNEFHFDRMTNLASSSIVNKAADKTTRSDSIPTTLRLISPEAASCYPKYVPDRQRLTCGAIGCLYISVDIAMFKRHWETLHSDTVQYHCVHCPPNQTLDTSRPLTAIRIIGHLKMHDSTLYACSMCTYYHFRKTLVEKHINEVHKNAQVMIVREEASPGPATVAPPACGAPTMDLKPWQCGLCNFKSMLRPEVVEHCAKTHQSKMQFKCSYCPFRTSTMENVFKHQSNAHANKSEELFYYYYREGSIPDEPDGTPLWKKQSQISLTDSEVKTEVSEERETSNVSVKASASPAVDLNRVKKEVLEPEGAANYEDSSNNITSHLSEFCEPSGLKYKCPLCTKVTEEVRENMQSHLYEELKYRKWACGICSYKAFHKTGLNEHTLSEHRGQKQEPIELPLDIQIEKWVSDLLEYQTNCIAKSRQDVTTEENRIEDGPLTSSAQEKPNESNAGPEKPSMKELEQSFGPFGVPSNMSFCCPKCDVKIKHEPAMKNHLESELTKIRWCCSHIQCSDKFQTYHEAQFHCKSKHAGQSARPTEAIRDPALRSAWVAAVIKVQKLCMKCMPVTETPTETSSSEKNIPESLDVSDNSLLMVRYEERVPTPEEQAPPCRKRPAPAPDSDDEKLIIDEEGTSKKRLATECCLYCNYKSPYKGVLDTHMLRHFNLKPYMCSYCDFTGHRQGALYHLDVVHPGLPKQLKRNELPVGKPPIVTDLSSKPMKKKISTVEDDRLTCLICDKTFKESESKTHKHDELEPQFARRGDVVVKCCICLALRTVLPLMQEHHDSSHPGVAMNYAFFKFHCHNRDIHYCEHCNNSFTYIRDLKSHHNAMHSSLPLWYTTRAFDASATLTSVDLTEETSSNKRSNEDSSILPTVKKVAKKSTTKLPNNKNVAKKSTTKLPYKVSGDSDDEEEPYSYYGTKPPSEKEYANVTTLMPFFNAMVPFTMKKLSGIINIHPKVVVTRVQK